MRKLLAFAFLLALIDLSLAKEAIKNMAPKQREIFSKVFDIARKYKEKQEKEEEEEKLRKYIEIKIPKNQTIIQKIINLFFSILSLKKKLFHINR